ncbi:phosphatidylinositol mannoside acyltransferase [soil metagenome]
MLPNPVYVVYRIANAVARLLPGRAVGPVARAAGALAARIMRGRAALVARHQRRVRPDLTPRQVDVAVVATFVSYASYWVESFRLPGTPAARLDAGLVAEGFDHIRQGIDEGNGVILAMPHLGGWEWAGFWLTAVKQMPVTAVVEAIEPPELAAWFTGLREDLGMEVVPLGPAAGRASVRALRNNRVLTLLCDRDLGSGGVEVDFFGERTTLPAGPATLALRSGAALVPAAVPIEAGVHRGLARPPLDTARQGTLRDDVARLTQELATEFEGLIRRAPEQWHLLQPNWPSDHVFGER